MSHWHAVGDELEQEELYDPLSVERSQPLDDNEAELIEAMCRASTPGPLVIDDETEGEGSVVVSLPDGRLIVSLAAQEHPCDEEAADANARLICRARHALLRLLRDRKQWQEQREFLLERIRTLEAALGDGQGPTRRGDGSRTPPKPR